MFDFFVLFVVVRFFFLIVSILMSWFDGKLIDYYLYGDEDKCYDKVE